MDKLFSFLNKKYDEHIEKNKYIKDKNRQMEITFKKCHLEFKNKGELDFYRNEIIYQGLLNKERIENAYFESKLMMQDYYATLDFNEKVRLINFEVNDVTNQMDYELFNEKKIFIPFFDEKLNHVYREEMALFDLKLYNRYHFEFKEIFKSDLYGTLFYDGKYTCAKKIYEDENGNYVLFAECLKRLLFFRNGQYENHITLINNIDDIHLKTLCINYYMNDKSLFALCLKENNLIREKDYKKIDKIIKKG